MAVLPRTPGAWGADLLGEHGVTAHHCWPWQPAVPPAVPQRGALHDPTAVGPWDATSLEPAWTPSSPQTSELPHYRSCPLLASPPSRKLKKGLSEIRYNTANHGYSWMFLLISAHLQTEVTKINRLMQTSADGNKSLGRESTVKCSTALPLILAAHLTHCI